ncbi:MAG: antitoxin AF2212-like protein [Pirellulales bacterium]
MSKPFQAIFELGVLKPLEPLSLAEHEVVTLIVANGDGATTIDVQLDDGIIDHDALAIAEREGDAGISLEQLHELLKSIPGSMSDTVIEERGEY